MKKKKIRSMILIMIIAMMVSVNANASEFIEQDPSLAAGYYKWNENSFILLNNGYLYVLQPNVEEEMQKVQVLSNGEDFILFEDENAVCFQRDNEKGKTENNGIYYRLYSEYMGTLEQIDFNEGRQVKFDKYIFGNDYDIVTRDPLATFFEVDGDMAEYYNGKFESDGYDSPEMAVAAYLDGFAENNINKMLKSFAIETYVDNYSLVKMIERMQSYSPAIKSIPVISEYSRKINIEMRRSSIMDYIRNQYLMLTESQTVVGERVGMTVPLAEKYNSGQELVEDIFTDDDTDVLQNIEFVGEYISPEFLSDGRYGSEQNQKNLQNQSEYLGTDKICSVAAVFSINSKPYLLVADTACYENRWYILNMQGNLGSILALSSSTGGIFPLFLDEAEIDMESIQSGLYRIE